MMKEGFIMSNPKNVMISYDLFLDLFRYFKCDMTDLAPDITSRLDDKFNRILSRDLFNDYLHAASPEEKEIAKQKYLDSKGIPLDYRF